jgi:hypothetical protein
MLKGPRARPPELGPAAAAVGSPEYSQPCSRLLISFTTNDGANNLREFSKNSAAHNVGVYVYLAGLEALACGDKIVSGAFIEIATRLRHRAKHRAPEPIK